ncbi:MAG: ribosome maturation factor RimM [Pseudomonadota bacterium]
MSIIETPDRIVVGRIAGVYGVQGWVKIVSYTEPKENILRYTPWYIQDTKTAQWRELPDVEARVHGAQILARLARDDNRESAQRWVGANVAVQRSQFAPLPPGEYYWADLIGLRVVTLSGEELGVVTELLETGANDVLIVQGAREHLIPYVKDSVVREIDLAHGMMRVDWDAEF